MQQKKLHGSLFDRKNTYPQQQALNVLHHAQDGAEKIDEDLGELAQAARAVGLERVVVEDDHDAHARRCIERSFDVGRVRDVDAGAAIVSMSRAVHERRFGSPRQVHIAPLDVWNHSLGHVCMSN